MEFFLIYLIKSAGLLLLFYIVYRLFLHRETWFGGNRLFLLSGIIVSGILPLFVITKVVESSPVFSGIAGSPVEGVSLEKDGTAFWSGIIFQVYITGVIFFLLRFAVQLYSLRRFLASGEKSKKDGVILIKTGEETSPFSFFNFLVYNPGMYNSSEELNIILAHEKAHIRQQHSLDILLIHFFTVLQWLNPMVWLYKKAMVVNLEYLADRQAAGSGKGDKRNYQLLLLRQTGAYQKYMTLTNTFFNSSIKKRVVMLQTKDSKESAWWKYGIIIPALAAFMFMVNTDTVVAQKSVGITTKNISDNVLLIINGELSEGGRLKDIQPDSIRAINIIKDEHAIAAYGERGENGAIEVYTKSYSGVVGVKGKGDIRIRKKSTPEAREERPLIVVNGRVKGRDFDMNSIPVSSIEAVNVMKGESALKKYGSRGADGVIEISVNRE